MTTTWNPSDKTSEIVLSNGNLTATESSGTYQAVRANTSHVTGKWYYELTVLYTLSGQELVFGISTLVDNIAANWYGNPYNAVARQTPVAGTVYGVAYDCATGKMWYSSNGTWVGDPVAGTGETETNSQGPGNAVAPYFASDNTTASPHGVTANFGATSFNYTPPTGFTAWEEPPVVLTAAQLYRLTAETLSSPNSSIQLSTLNSEVLSSYSNVYANLNTITLEVLSSSKNKQQTPTLSLIL